MAEEVESFEGVPLSDYLQDQLGVPEGAEVEAEVYLYEALPGTTVADIARSETETPSLGASDEAAVAQLHPLTREAASALLGKPGLGRSPLPGFRQVEHGRRTTAISSGNCRKASADYPWKSRPPPRSATLPYQCYVGCSARSDSCLHLHQRGEGPEARGTPTPAIARGNSDCQLQQDYCPQAAPYPAGTSAPAASDRTPPNTTRTIRSIGFTKTTGACSAGLHYEDARMAGAWLRRVYQDAVAQVPRRHRRSC